MHHITAYDERRRLLAPSERVIKRENTQTKFTMASRETAQSSAVEVAEYYDGKEAVIEVNQSKNSSDAPEVHVSQDESRDLDFAIQQLEAKKKHWYSYMLTKEFWIVLALG